MRWSWLPWKFLLRRAARRHGFLDPLALMARMQRLAQPSEVSEPIELLRAGVLFHARGLINTRVIQHNLDWVWPFWIERQFDPYSESFLPRAFSITHVNLTHRNWTAVGRPDCDELPIVDPRGLVTPYYDGWSLDAWVLGTDGDRLFPSRTTRASQRLNLDDGLAVETESGENGLRLRSRAWVEDDGSPPTLRIRYQAYAEHGGELALALRPYNPEGVSFVYEVALNEDRRGWTVDGRRPVGFSDEADRHASSDYRHGDVAMHLDAPDPKSARECDAGLATAAALFRLTAGERRTVTVSIPIGRRSERQPRGGWEQTLAPAARFEVSDERDRFLYDAALRTVALHTVDDIYPGPYTYKRFWFRDAAFIVNALQCVGLRERARRGLELFPGRQNPATGYFHSQEGEWDSNGQVLWVMARHAELTGKALPAEWLASLRRGGRWITRKRTDPEATVRHAGLLPAGFSAEHFGPNDYYYWDDYWAVAGLRAAAPLFSAAGNEDIAREFRAEADDLEATLDRCVAGDAERLGRAVIPASPYRRMDTGAIGSLVAGYPLGLRRPDDPALLGTADYLYRHARVHGGFFQDMIHSGVNAYLTIHMAQVLMRAGDPRCFELVEAAAALATSTGQWPEAIHPRTKGGCMGDGQHVWAAAEWLLMIRNSLVREEGDSLVLAGGVPPRWLRRGSPVRFGPAPTRFGDVSVTVVPEADGGMTVDWQCDWRRRPAAIEVGTAGGERVSVSADTGSVRLRRRVEA